MNAASGLKHTRTLNTNIALKQRKIQHTYTHGQQWKKKTHIYTWPTMKENNTHIHMANNERKKHTYTHGQQWKKIKHTL